MLQSTFITSAVFSLAAGVVSAQDPAPAQPAGGDASPPKANVDFLYWKPLRGNLDYAATDIFTSPSSVRSVDPDFAFGYRAAVEFDRPGKVGFSFRIALFSDRSSDSTTDPGETLYATRTHPDGSADIYSGDVGTASSAFDLDYLAVDIEMGFESSHAGGQVLLRPVLGFRWFGMDQELKTRYTNGLGDIVDVTETLDSSGFGFYGGTALSWKLSESVAVGARAVVGVLFVNGDAGFFEAEPDDGVVNFDIGRDEDTVVPFLEIGLAVTHRIQVGDSSVLHVGLGYELVVYTGMQDFLTFPDDVNDSVIKHSTANVGFHGLAIRAVLEF